MAVNQEYKLFIEDQLSGMPNIESKSMFGGIGFFREGTMFAMIGKGVLRFRVDDTNRAEYEAGGMEAMQSAKKGKGMPYYEVPQKILDDKDELVKWAEKAYEVALANKK